VITSKTLFSIFLFSVFYDSSFSGNKLSDSVIGECSSLVDFSFNLGNSFFDGISTKTEYTIKVFILKISTKSKHQFSQ